MDNYENSSRFENSTKPFFEIAQAPVWSIVVFMVVMVIIMVLAVIGNSVILIMELLNKQKTSTDWLVTFMSANDIVLACNVPIYILLYSGSWETTGSSFLCALMTFVQETCSYSSCLLLTVTAVDRYFKTCRPHVTGITPHRARLLCLMVTGFTLAVAAPLPFHMTNDTDVKCRYTIPGGAVSTLFTVIMFSIQATFFVMFLTVTTAYCKVALTIRARVGTLLQASQLESTSLKIQHIDISRRNNRVAPETISSCSNKVIPIHIRVPTVQPDQSTHSRDSGLPVPAVFTVTKDTALQDMASKRYIQDIDLSRRDYQDTDKHDHSLEHDYQETSFIDNALKSEYQDTGANDSALKLGHEDTGPNDNALNVDNPVSAHCHNNNFNTNACINGATEDETLESVRSNRLRIAQTQVRPQRNPKEMQMNRTTAIMFAVTVVFVLSWIPPWVSSALWPQGVSETVLGSVAILFCRRSFMINTCTNPLFYIGMSSVFRRRVKQTMSKPWHRLQGTFDNTPGL